MNVYDADCFACAAIHTQDHICPMHALAPAMAEMVTDMESALQATDRKNLYASLRQKARAILQKTKL